MTQNWKDLCVVDGEKPSVVSRNEGKHTGRMICYSYFIIVLSLGWVLYEQVIGCVAFVVSQF